MSMIRKDSIKSHHPDEIVRRAKRRGITTEELVKIEAETYNLIRDYLLKKKYGITSEEYDRMLTEQNYSCYICHKHEDKLDRSLAVDHCHETGKVRGLLCGNCNRFLGQINDNIDTASRLLEYLKKHKNI